MEFPYVLYVLNSELNRLDFLGDNSKVDEIRSAIQVFTDGQGYLTNTMPKKVIFFEEL